MKLVLKFILFFMIGFIQMSCGQLSGNNTGANLVESPDRELIGGVDAISVKEKSFLLSGTVDNGGNSGHFFRLRFKLPEAKSLKFYFFTSSDFAGGVVYLFKRVNGVVKLKIELNDKSHTRDLSVFNETEIVDVDVDIHNNHTDIHLFVWKHSGLHEDNEDCSFDGGCLYNSEDFAFDYWLGVGRASGTFWGFKGDKSLILTLQGPLSAISNA